MSVKRCKSCGREVIMMISHGGYQVACDPDQVRYRLDYENGRRIVTGSGEQVMGRIVSEGDDKDGFGFIPHADTCAERWDFR